MKKKISLNTIWFIITGIILVTQIFFIIYMYINHSTTMLDYDSSNVYTHMVEMFKNGDLFISDWINTTTLELDCSSLFALPLYAITKNVFLSYGISNIIIILMYIGTIYTIFINTGYKKYANIACSLFLIPYSYGMLEYTNMLFFNASQYALKTLVPLLFISLFFFCKNRNTSMFAKIFFYIQLAVYFILLFITSFSSGIYVLLCGILPLLGLYLLYMIRSEKITKEHLMPGILVLATGIVSLLGILISKKNECTFSRKWIAACSN